MLIDELPQSVNKLVMSLSAYSIQGKRNHMEDYFDIGYQMKPCDTRRPNEWPYEYFYFGIFDGHGGSEAAQYAKKNLLRFIVQQKDFWSTDDEDVKRAIRKGFADTHEAMRQEMPKWARTSKILPSTAGTTASVLFIRNGKFYTGHVGDSRIVISQENPETNQWISRQLTDDHKPESKQEIQRIQRAGGEVKSKIGVHRVVWKRPVLNCDMECRLIFGEPASSEYKECLKKIPAYPVSESLVDSYQIIPFLAIARSLGDFWSINPYTGQYVVSPEPDVSCRPITLNDKCILLATDGLWNVMNSSQAIRILQELNILKNDKRQYHEDEYFTIDNFYEVAGMKSQNHAMSLVYFAYQIYERRRLRSDNITVVVAMLHDILSNFHKATNNSKSPYVTRASIHSEKDHLSNQSGVVVRDDIIQLGNTDLFIGKIMLNDKPNFSIDKPFAFDERLRILEDFLILPPTILEQEYRFKEPKVIHPKNYKRLSWVRTRSIVQKNPGRSDTIICVKQVSDDPSDGRALPTRISRSGKEIKDASAQATQNLHDFGQPWSQLIFGPEPLVYDSDEVDDDWGSPFHPDNQIEEGDLEDDLEDDIKDWSEEDDIKDWAEEDDIKDWSEEDDCEEEGVEIKAEKNTSKEKNNISKEKNNISKEKNNISKDKKSIPQLRCLLNYTPPLRRSTRSAYLSVSDNTKRKLESTTSTPSSKSKRRKSQPIRCSSTRSLSRI